MFGQLVDLSFLYSFFLDFFPSLRGDQQIELGGLIGNFKPRNLYMFTSLFSQIFRGVDEEVFCTFKEKKTLCKGHSSMRKADDIV